MNTVTNLNSVPANWIIIAAVLLIALAAVAAAIISHRHRQSLKLQRRFGAEYDRSVERLGSRTKAEAELRAREKRVADLHIAPLAPADAARFTQSWNALQSRFIDSPKGVVVEAEQLVRELLLKRGYPMGDFERRAADMSVDHPAIVENYRAAQAIAVRAERGEADTEQLRKAVVHYRTLFDELLEVRPVKETVPPPRQVPVHS